MAILCGLSLIFASFAVLTSLSFSNNFLSSFLMLVSFVSARGFPFIPPPPDEFEVEEVFLPPGLEYNAVTLTGERTEGVIPTGIRAATA
eukprot:CAMPEP_0118639174 /NCGR_PEP_ID=MMETSP0785-20121206/4083_1 /TAXON_ID=91992 /ORGANISM="Bolidomonas pacifica, Strain CCMP 1866" /LENGTH=88 /DNA_ID=CAMNT_0006530485 /DNA_START=802 /DNA_END=1068 /DNA_ORIENTATION=+